MKAIFFSPFESFSDMKLFAQKVNNPIIGHWFFTEIFFPRCTFDCFANAISRIAGKLFTTFFVFLSTSFSLLSVLRHNWKMCCLEAQNSTFLAPKRLKTKLVKEMKIIHERFNSSMLTRQVTLNDWETLAIVLNLFRRFLRLRCFS